MKKPAPNLAPLFAVSPSASPYRLPVWMDGFFAIATNGRDLWAIAEAVAPSLKKPQLVPVDVLKAATAAEPGRFDFDGQKLNGQAFAAASRRQFDQFPDVPDLDAFDFPEAFAIDTGRLKGALKACADKDVRYYLNGIGFDFANHAIVATDGHRLHGWNSDTLPAIAARRVAIMPRDAAFLLLRVGAFKLTYADREIAGRIEGWFVAHYDGGTLIIKATDGQFPDWRRTVPQDLGQRQPLRLDRIATLASATAAKKAGARWLEFHGQKMNPAYIADALQAAPDDIDLYPGDDARPAVLVSGPFAALIMGVKA